MLTKQAPGIHSVSLHITDDSIHYLHHFTVAGRWLGLGMAYIYIDIICMSQNGKTDPPLLHTTDRINFPSNPDEDMLLIRSFIFFSLFVSHFFVTHPVFHKKKVFCIYHFYPFILLVFLRSMGLSLLKRHIQNFHSYACISAYLEYFTHTLQLDQTGSTCCRSHASL